MASVMVWCASGLNEPSDIAEAMKRRTMVGADFHLVQRRGRRGRTNLQQVTQYRRLILGRLGTEGSPGLSRRQARPTRSASSSSHDLQGFYRLRLPAMRLRTIVFAEANPTIVGQGFGLALRHRRLRGRRRRLRIPLDPG